MSPLPAKVPCWVAWREDTDRKTGKKRKTPYDFNTGRPLNTYLDRAYWTQDQVPRKELRGFVLGMIDDESAIIGLDLDTCLDAAGELASWAREALDAFNSYVEISPSGTGVKAYARVDAATFKKIGKLLHGRVRSTWAIAAGEHPPGIMLALRGYFAVTDQALEKAPLRTISFDEVQQVIAIGERIERHAKSEAGLSPHAGWNDESGSGESWRLAVETRRAKGSFEDFIDEVGKRPEALRSLEESPRGYEGQAERDWERACAKVEMEEASRIDPFRDHGSESSAMLKLHRYENPDAKDIPPRQSLYGWAYARGTVSATVAPGGAGKTALTITEALAMASGRDLLGVAPLDRPLNVLLWNLEDDIDELNRRLKAGQILFAEQLKGADITPHLWVNAASEPLKLGRVVSGAVQLNLPLIKALIEELLRRQIDVLIVDPWVSAHGVPESDNDAVDQIVKEGFARIAREAHCAVHLVHHVRKRQAGQSDHTIEDARGASALINACRFGRVVNRMSEGDAPNLGVSPESAWAYVRVDPGKANLAPPGAATWRRLTEVNLRNGTFEKDNSDRIGVVEAWEPPDLTRTNGDERTRITEAMQGRAWRKDAQAEDWAGYAFAEALRFDLDDKRDKAEVKKRILGAIKAGWLIETTITVDRKPRPALKARERRSQADLLGEIAHENA